jgi:hypothetical protein
VRIAPIALAACAVVVALTGCSTTAPPVAPSTSTGPPSFPRIAGTVLSTVQPVRGDWVVTVRVADPPAAYREARTLLTAHGYQLTLDEPVVDGGNGQACTTQLCVGFSALTRPGVGRTLQYEVFHSTGVVG